MIPLPPTPAVPLAAGTGVWCEVRLAETATGREWPLSAYLANSARLALRWLVASARRLADLIDPPLDTPWIPTAALRVPPPGPDPAHHLRAWAAHVDGHAGALCALREGPCRVTAHDETVRYCVSACPVRTAPPAGLFLPHQPMQRSA